MRIGILCGVLVGTVGLWATAAETLLTLPVSSVGNPAYLASMPERPWWNTAWTRRAPLLVSSASEVADAKAIVDVVVDFGEEVNPDEVRVVTPWETEVPCVAEAVRGTDRSVRSPKSVRLLFRTPLRIQENKPFLVYWGNPAAKTAKPRSCLSLEETESEIRVSNGILEVVFDRLARTDGPIKSIRLLASQADSELLTRATDYAWAGFEFSADGVAGLSNAVVTVDNALKKEIRLSNGKADVFFSLAPESPRIDWRYVLAPDVRGAKVGVSWACGGDTVQDDLVYPGAAGKPLVLRAGLDQATDNIPHPEYAGLDAYLSEGWYAIRDRRAQEAVGMLFDRAALRSFRYSGHGQASGEMAEMTFVHAPKKGARAEQSGALVVLKGDAEDVRTEYVRGRSSLRVLVGATEPFAEHPLRKPDFLHDFVADYNIGFGSGHGWRAGEPLSDPAWADNVMNRLRAYGANAARLGCYRNYTPYMKLSEDLHGRIRAVAMRPDSPLKDTPWPDWTAERFDGRNIRRYAEAAHRRGMLVSNWPTYLCLGRSFRTIPGYQTDPELNALDRELQSAFVDSGVDVINCYQTGGEGPKIPPDLVKKWGKAYWTWPDPAVYFDKVVEAEHTNLKLCYEDVRKRHPGVPLVLFNSENGEINREKFMGEFSGLFDTAYVEMLPRGWMHHCKYVAKRMRAVLGNEAGRTMHHHFYFYDLSERARVNEVEMPFMCGVNGFSTENYTYGNHDPEYNEIPADFYRFAEYTKLGDKAARMAPVKDLAVFRDDAAFRADILARRTVGKNKWDTFALGDRRVAAFGSVPNLAWDIVVNRFFTPESLAQYRVVYLPSNETLSDALVEALLTYVKAGGGAVVEGAAGEKVEKTGEGGQWRDKFSSGEVVSYGKGKIVWMRDSLSEQLATVGKESFARHDWLQANTSDGTRSAWRRLRTVLASVGARQPSVIDNDKIDSVLQASDEGMLLSVYNLSDTVETGKVFLNPQPSASLFVLDVKNGVRFPCKNGFAVSAGPRQCGYYLIGDETFTALPAVRRARGLGGLCSVAPNGKACKPPRADGFAPARAIEFVTVGKDGQPVRIRRSDEAMIKRTAFTETDEGAFKKALKTATYVHFQSPTETWDGLFATCAEDLKAFLKRGGGFFFDKRLPGRRAHAFLESVGVFDPSPFAVEGAGDGTAGSDTTGECPTNSLVFATITSRGMSNGLNYSRSFAKWDRARQMAPYRPYRATDHAVAIAQENVLGKGKVLFQTNSFVFSDFYENKVFGNAVLSWLIGRPVAEHVRLVRERNGGPGTPLERRGK